MIDKNLKPINLPIFLSATFSQKTPSQWGYSRIDNPTRLYLEEELARLEKARFSLVFSSGSAAIATILSMFSKGDHIICHEEIYDGTLRLLEKVFKKFGVEFSLIDLSNKSRLKTTIKKNTKAVFLETITNPTLKTIDVEKNSKITKEKNIRIIVDNTIATPFFKNPLAEGADIVVHSLTKFISGHHDVTAGVIMFNDQKLFKELSFLQHTIGAVPSPFDCFLIKRGIETFELRMKRHKENADKIVNFLKKHKKISKVSYPNISGLISFWLKGSKKEVLKFLKLLKIIKIAHSFGGTKSTILHPVSMMTFSLKKSKREKIGIVENLVRLSVGLEDINLLINDLKRALK